MKFYTRTQAAEFLGVTPNGVKNWLLSGRLVPTYTTPGGHGRFSERCLKEFMKGRTVTPDHRVVVEVELTDEQLHDLAAAEAFVRGMAADKAAAALRELVEERQGGQ